jgi:hypothetical protein
VRENVIMAGTIVIHFTVFMIVPAMTMLLLNLFNPQPLSDNLLMAKVFYLIAIAAAVPAFVVDFWIGRSRPSWNSLPGLGLVAGVVPALLLFWFDWYDDYFTKPGVGVLLPLIGYCAGTAYGVILALCLLRFRSR